MQFTAKFLRSANEKRTFRGLPILIESPKGSIRKGTDPTGREWSREMTVDYGYIPGTSAAGDTENLDVYVGEDETSDFAYVVEQVGPDGEFDEYKVMLGFPDLESAQDAFEEHGPDQWDGIGDIYEVPLDYLFDAVEEHQSKTAAESTPVIDKFLEEYSRARKLYSRAADAVRSELVRACADKDIRAAITARAKGLDSLRTKLILRNAKRPYVDSKDILHDIKDFAGVRVALYFPIDKQAIDEIINGLYESARPPKHFPEDKEPDEPEGYVATHYAVKYAGLVVEIQVASALMVCWAEVSHDLIYKPRHGVLTPEELQLLEELKILVLEGEKTTVELQRSVLSHTASFVSPKAQKLVSQLKVSLDKCLSQMR